MPNFPDLRIKANVIKRLHSVMLALDRGTIRLLHPCQQFAPPNMLHRYVIPRNWAEDASRQGEIELSALSDEKISGSLW